MLWPVMNMDDETRNALAADIRFALRKLDPWPPKDPSREGEKARQYAEAVIRQLELSGYKIERGEPVRYATSDEGHPGPLSKR